LIVILGSTASGKSQLALDIAQKINGEIINADSMQVYSGNSGIMTAKPTPDDLSKAVHHLYDYVPIEKLDFTVRDYERDFETTLRGILEWGKVPILIGGTNYYIENVVFTQLSNDMMKDEETKIEMIPDELIEVHEGFKEKYWGTQRENDPSDLEGDQ
jgi:tRNA dimethylallyltransferase